MDLKIKVIGAGGVGGCLLPTLCRVLNYGAGDYNFNSVELTIIDGDEYEDKNRKRQAFASYDNKASSTAEILEKEFLRIKIQSHSAYLREDNTEIYLSNNDVIFLCVDNHATRSVVSKFCEKSLSDFTLISGGNEITDGNIQVFHRKDGQDLTLPLHNAYHDEIVNPTDSIPIPQPKFQVMDCTKRAEKDPQLLIANFAVASLMLNAFHTLVSSGKVEYDEVYFDVCANKVRPVKRS